MVNAGATGAVFTFCISSKRLCLGPTFLLCMLTNVYIISRDIKSFASQLLLVSGGCFLRLWETVVTHFRVHMQIYMIIEAETLGLSVEALATVTHITVVLVTFCLCLLHVRIFVFDYYYYFI